MREGSGTQSIHIVDDDEAVRDSLAALVESAGLSAKVYASAIELLTSPGGLAADCLVADIRMPEMDGLELQHELKRRGMTMPLILITGHADVGLAVQAMKAGASDFLEKPFEGERLLASLKDALGAGMRSAAHQRGAQCGPRPPGSLDTSGAGGRGPAGCGALE